MDEYHLFLVGVAIFLVGYLWNYKERQYLKGQNKLEKLEEDLEYDEQMQKVANHAYGLHLKQGGTPYRSSERDKHKNKINKTQEQIRKEEYKLNNPKSLASITEIIGVVIAVINLIKILKI